MDEMDEMVEIVVECVCVRVIFDDNRMGGCWMMNGQLFSFMRVNKYSIYICNRYIEHVMI